jgi:hypothetical protein
MAVLDFPSSPAIGDKYPATVVEGLPQYTWDGVAWSAYETPQELTYVKRSGDTMAGALNLYGPNYTRYKTATSGGAGAGLHFDTPTITDKFFIGVAQDQQNWWLYDKTWGTRISVEGATGVMSFPGGATVPTPATVGGGNTSIANTAYVEARAQAWAATAIPISGNVTVTGPLNWSYNNRFLIPPGGAAGMWFDCAAAQNVFVGGSTTSSNWRVHRSGYGDALMVQSDGTTVVNGTLSCVGVVYVGGQGYYNPGGGWASNGFSDGGGYYICNLISGSPNHGASGFQTLHYPGAWAGVRMYIGDGTYFDFRTGGQAYKAGGGSWADLSDARIKDVQGDYTSGLDQVCALQPVRFKYKGNDSSTLPSHFADGRKPEDVPEQKDDPTAPYANSPHYTAAIAGTEFIGLIAQDTQPHMPEMVSTAPGYIDGTQVLDLHTLDTTALIYALINSVKELKARIEQLEAPPVARR